MEILAEFRNPPPLLQDDRVVLPHKRLTRAAGSLFDVQLRSIILLSRKAESPSLTPDAARPLPDADNLKMVDVDSKLLKAIFDTSSPGGALKADKSSQSHTKRCRGSVAFLDVYRAGH